MDDTPTKLETADIARILKALPHRYPMLMVDKVTEMHLEHSVAETVAPTESTILISGESGSGKEVIARYIHALSERADKSTSTAGSKRLLG